MGRKQAKNRRRMVRPNRVVRFLTMLSLFSVLATGTAAVFKSSLFDCTRIDVKGLVQLDARMIKKLSGLKTGKNVFKQSMVSACRRVAEHPAVLSVECTRRLPGVLILRVTERKPIAVYDTGRGFYRIDMEGNLFGTVAKSDLAAMPLIKTVSTKTSSASAANICCRYIGKIRKRQPSLYKQIRTVILDDPHRPVFVLRGLNIRVRVDAMRNIDETLSMLATVLADNHAKLARLSSIDLSMAGRATVRFQGGRNG